MAEYTPVIDVTEQFFNMERDELNGHVRSLGEGALVGVSFSLLDANGDESNKLLLRKLKAFTEYRTGRLAIVLATEYQATIEPNAFSSGITRVSPDIDT